MNVNIFYLFLIVTLFNVCSSRKSGLYPDQNNDVSSSEEEGANGFNNNNDSYVEQNDRKSSLYGDPNNQNQEQGQNQQVNQDNSQSQNNNNETKTRHQYKYSFKRPYYYYNDTNVIPNWQQYGDVIPAADMIRLVPSVPNRLGSIWSNLQNQFNEWQVVFSFRISGRSLSGSDGLAMFYTNTPLKVDTFYGSEHQWNGLAIIFDTANVDQNSHIPTINVLYNDGNTVIQSQKNYNDIRKSVCVADFRNSPNPIYVRITYLNKKLKVEVDLSHEGSEYYECSTDEIDLPNNYYFGVSAKSGNSNPDDHDILSFDFYQLNPPPKENHRLRPKEEQIIEEEGEYQIDNETLEQIRKVNEQIGKEEQEKQKDDGQEKIINARTVQITQFRILETVNRILSYVQNQKGVNGDQSDLIEDMNNRSDQLIADVNEMYENMESLNQKVDYVTDTVERNSQKHEYKLNTVETKLNQKIISEMNKVLNELKNVKDENRKLKEETRYLSEQAKSQPNTWLVVFISFFLNMLGIYIIIRVLPSRGSTDLFKTHNY